MKLINGILNFIGLSGFLVGAVLYILGYEAVAIISLAVSLLSFAQMLFFNLYRMYLLDNLKKKAQAEQLS